MHGCEDLTHQSFDWLLWGPKWHRPPQRRKWSHSHPPAPQIILQRFQPRHQSRGWKTSMAAHLFVSPSSRVDGSTWLRALKACTLLRNKCFHPKCPCTELPVTAGNCLAESSHGRLPRQELWGTSKAAVSMTVLCWCTAFECKGASFGTSARSSQPRGWTSGSGLAATGNTARSRRSCRHRPDHEWP